MNKVLDGRGDPVDIEIEASRELSVAMVENSVALVARISLTNVSNAVLSNLIVEAALLPDFSSKWTAHVSAIPPGGTFEPMPIARGASPGDTVEAYRIAPVPEGRFSPEDVHDDRHRTELKRVLLGIVDIEAPLSLTVLARRVAPCFAIQRTTGRLEERLRAVLGRAVTITNEIIWRVDQDPNAYTGVRLAPAEARREAQEIPLEEVANAAVRVLRANIALSQDELTKLTAKSLGFPRASGTVADHLSAAVALLVKRGRAKRDGDKVVLA